MGAREVTVGLKLRALSPRAVEIRADARVLWRGEVREKLEWFDVVLPLPENGRAVIEVHSDAPPVPENDHADARRLGLAVYGLRMK